MKVSWSRKLSDQPFKRNRFIAAMTAIVVIAATGLLVGVELLRSATDPTADDLAPGGHGATDTDRPLLIKHGWDIPEVSFVANNAANMAQMPFDGVVMRMDEGLSSEVQRQEPISYDTFRRALSPAGETDLKSMQHNFLIIYSTPAGDIFDNWSTPLDNFANVARAADEAGFEGVFFDNEEYYGNAIEYNDNCRSGRTVDQCRKQAFHRGQQVMNAIRSTWPDARVLVAHGPYIADDGTADYLNGHGMQFNDIAWANELRGDFAVGMASATIGNRSQFIDGGEVYSARTAQNFNDLKFWQKEGFAAQSSLVPDTLKPHWPENTSAAFGVYDSSASNPPMDPSVWQSTLTNALQATDRYVWAYTERHDWWGTGHPNTSVPAEWVIATRQSRGS